MRENFVIRLSNVKDSYYGFVAAVLNYTEKKSQRMDAVQGFMDTNPSALTTDILGFISEQEDFYEDAVYDQTGMC